MTSVFDIDSFSGFRPFLLALDDYARRTGYRFRSSDFEDPNVPGAAIVLEYTRRIQVGEPALMHDLGTAAKLCEREGLRNVMIATCKELKLWPPSTPDRLQSIAYSDTSEPLDAIAWALFNHDKCVYESEQTRSAHQRQCSTASFIVDFAHAIGCLDVSQTSKAGSALLMDFLLRAKEWTDTRQRQSVRKIIIRQLREFADEAYVKEIEVWLDRHWEAVAVGSIALVAGLVIGAIALSARSRK